jgi:cystathionine beta-lyase
MQEDNQFTRSIQLSSSLHFDRLADYRAAGKGEPTLGGQTAVNIDNGYGLQGNPTLHELQDSISKLETGKYSLLYPSGSTALNALEVFLNQGDHWLMPDSVYFPVRRYADYLKQHYGIKYDLYNPKDLSTLAGLIKEKTKLIHIETPSSVTFDITDVEEVVKIAKSNNILTSADNTWASGILYKPLEHGIDISVLSLTKYVAGYSDVFMGSITTRDKEMYKSIAYHHRVNGYTVSPFSAMLVKRGLESLKVRLEAEGANALRLIEAIKDNKNISKIYYVDSAKVKSFKGPNSLFSIELDRPYADTELEKLFSVLSTFKIGESWGGTRSMVLPFQPVEFNTRIAPPKNTIIRFHSGLEDIKLQLADVKAFVNAIG